MNENDKLRVKRYHRAFCGEDGVNELNDEEILMRIRIEKAHYRAMNKFIESRITELNSI